MLLLLQTLLAATLRPATLLACRAGQLLLLLRLLRLVLLLLHGQLGADGVQHLQQRCRRDELGKLDGRFPIEDVCGLDSLVEDTRLRHVRDCTVVQCGTRYPGCLV